MYLPVPVFQTLKIVGLHGFTRNTASCSSRVPPVPRLSAPEYHTKNVNTALGLYRALMAQGRYSIRSPGFTFSEGNGFPCKPFWVSGLWGCPADLCRYAWIHTENGRFVHQRGTEIPFSARICTESYGCPMECSEICGITRSAPPAGVQAARKGPGAKSRKRSFRTGTAIGCFEPFPDLA